MEGNTLVDLLDNLKPAISNWNTEALKTLKILREELSLKLSEAEELGKRVREQEEMLERLQKMLTAANNRLFTYERALAFIDAHAQGVLSEIKGLTKEVIANPLQKESGA